MLTVKGVTVVGPLPGYMANVNTYTAAIPAASPRRAEAMALLQALTNPASAARWTAAGLEPAFC
jgi:molybdate transport system substrate-binding protein